MALIGVYHPKNRSGWHGSMNAERFDA